MLENIVKGKRIDNDEWIIGYYWEGGQRSFIIAHDQGAMFNEATNELLIKVHEVDVRTLCRCTGKPDKDDKVMFEHDQVKFEREGQEPIYYNVALKNSVVNLSGKDGETQTVAELCGFLFESGEQDLLPGIDEEGVPDYRKMEIVGNIFDELSVKKSESAIIDLEPSSVEDVEGEVESDEK